MGTTITKPILLDSTGQEIYNAIEKQNSILSSLMLNSSAAVSDYQDIARIVRNGYAQDVFNIGDQIFVEWTDIVSSTTYTVPTDIVRFGDVTLESGDVKPGMYLQWHYATPFGVQFDNYEAFYVAETEALPAGTYNITMGSSWGSNVTSGKTYQFTLTQDLPIGGQLSGLENMPNAAPDTWKVKSFATASATTATETVDVTEGNEGTNLGTLTPKAEDGVLNSMHCVGYGYNRWSKSAIRQYLNSALAKNAWWTSQHKFDRPPTELTTKAGFMSGFTDDFLSVLKPVKVVTAKNTVNDDGALEETYDTFFLPSLEEEYIVPEISGEGDIFEYWRIASNRTSPIPRNTAGAAPIAYAINAKTSPQNVRLRSANRGNGDSTWYVNASGSVNGSGAVGGGRFAPACVIC